MRVWVFEFLLWLNFGVGSYENVAQFLVDVPLLIIPSTYTWAIHWIFYKGLSHQLCHRQVSSSWWLMDTWTDNWDKIQTFIVELILEIQ